MADFSKYDLDLQKYYDKLPSYIQTPGGLATGQIRLLFDIMNDYKNNMVDLWSKFNINTLLNEYLVWYLNKINNSEVYGIDFTDADWKYTDLVEKLCKSYDIIREHPVELDPIGNPGVGTILRNSHMLRLLKVKVSGVGFDGTKEKLEEILGNIFTGNLRYIVQTVNQEHAEANIWLIKPSTDLSFDDTDSALFESAYYFLELLGITLNFDVINTDTLVYDYTKYDPYDPEVIDPETGLPDGNKYDEGVTE